MHKIYSSNRLENLCQTLAGNIRDTEYDLFGKEVIITQTAGMNAWVKTELARINSVFANFEFQNQDGLFAGIYQLLYGQPFRNNIDAIKYKIYGFLGCDDFNDEFPDVAGYYKESDLRRFQLASRIADLFDQYQLYRHEMIDKWEQGSLSTENSAEKWEKWLWLKLEIESRHKIRNRMYEQMKARQEEIRKRYPLISLFGITVYTRFHLDFFMEFSKYTRVTFYLCLPADHSEHRNELLASYGTKARELAEMFNLEDFIPEKNKKDTLLARLQNQVLKNTNDLHFTDDGSLQVNSCYTPVREAECLYNYLLDLFDNDRTLKPGDVLVMTTDINKYAPFIKAVFRNAPVNIPFQVSGAANNSEDSIVAALELLLNFTEDDLTSEKVVSLLEQKRIKQRFGIQDVSYIRSAVRKANIRFGLENSEDDDTRYVSWKYGLEKIVLGCAMLTDDEFENKYPFREAEGAASYDLLRLKAFVEQLEALLDIHNKKKTPAGWKTFLFDEVIDQMIFRDDFNKDDRAELSSIYRALSFTDNLEFQEELPFSVFLDELKSKLFTESREIKLNTGRVTVSAPIPVRGLPFKVICFLGLDNDVFPRKDRFTGFNFLGEQYLAGDRNKKETDKYLFLDTLLAAREKLYLSYIGQSVKDNTEIPPSIVVDTLLDYLGPKMKVVKHPLHGFSSRYKKDDKRLFTYLYNTKTSDTSNGEKAVKEVSEVSIGSLVKFFQAPVDWYFKTILGIVYDEKDDGLNETELFELDNLQAWKIKTDMLFLNDTGLDSYLDKGKKDGSLPLKSAATATMDSILKELTYIKPAIKELTGEYEEKKIVIDIGINKIRITGTINNIYNSNLIAFSVSKYPLKYKIEAYIKALLLSVEGQIKTAKFIDKNGVVTDVPVSATTAYEDLAALLEYYKMGYDTPLLFTLAAAEKALKDGEVLMAIKDEAYPNERSPFPANRYLQILYREHCFEKFGEPEIQRITDIAGKLKINQF